MLPILTRNCQKPAPLLKSSPTLRDQSRGGAANQHAIDAQRAPVHSSSCGALLRLCEAICDLCRFYMRLTSARPSRALSHDDITLSAVAFRSNRYCRLSRHRDPARVGVSCIVLVESSLLPCNGTDELSKVPSTSGQLLRTMAEAFEGSASSAHVSIFFRYIPGGIPTFLTFLLGYAYKARSFVRGLQAVSARRRVALAQKSAIAPSSSGLADLSSPIYVRLLE
jgi:hypothetical protein